jgi:hypothetical protein
MRDDGLVGVGLGQLGRGDEDVPRHLPQRRGHPGIGNAAPLGEQRDQIGAQASACIFAAAHHRT